MLTLVLLSGLEALLEYLSAHVIACLLPAFFIAGAISAFVKKETILKYFGPSANKLVSYAVASVAGVVLAVCSCTILPLFSGIYTMGAGIGPATTFLYSGPAINLLAMIYTARLLGVELGIARAVGAISFSLVIGMIMSLVFQRKASRTTGATFDAPPQAEASRKRGSVTLLFFADLVAVLVLGAWGLWWIVAVLLGLLVLLLRFWFTREEVFSWLRATWQFARLILPWLFIGVFVAGILRTFLPPEVIKTWVGGNTASANFVASVAGALMYFSTLTEVPILRAFLDLGMGKGPALALLLAGPALSLPNMLVIRSIMGTRKTLVYIGLVVVMSALVGMIFGTFVF